LRPGSSVCEKPQAVVGHSVAQHPKFDSPTVVVLVGQIVHESDFVFGAVMPEYPVCMVHKRLVPCTGIVIWFFRVWQFFAVDEMEEEQQIGKAMFGKHFPKPWGGLGTDSGTI
jgi:hypothetical protein